MPSSALPTPKRRRVGGWILGGVVLGFILALGLVSLPPVQAWLLRRALAAQPGTTVDFTRLALGPRGAEATDVKLRLPNLTLEARALRVAISPWQLLSRRRLAIADLHAEKLAVEATTSDAASPDSAPFTGVLDSFHAPLAWACEKAAADGVLTVLQPGSPAVAVTFQLNGTGLDIAQPGRLDFEFTTPGEFIAGFKGTWKFKGTLNYVPGPGERIDALTVTGTLTPALSESLHLPSLTVTLSARRTADGEHYEIACAPQDTDAEKTFTFDSRADYARAAATITGDWKIHGVSGLVAHILRRTDLPQIVADTSGKFSVSTHTGEAEATASGNFTGAEWQRFDAALAAVGRLTGTHAVKLERRAGAWSLTQLDAHARSDGSQAALHLSLERPVTLPPGGDHHAAPWGKLAVEKMPLGWAAPILGVERITGGEFAGSWSIRSPNATTLRFEPLEKLHATDARIVHAAWPEKKNPALTLDLTSRLTLTAEEAQVEIPELLITSAQADRLQATIEARVSLDTLEGKMKAAWTSQLPTWLGGPQAPSIAGSLEATGGTERATVTAFHVGASHADAGSEAFSLDLLAPLKVDFENLEAVEAAEGEVLKFTARDLRLDWAASMLPGFALTGVVTEGASQLRREGQFFVVSTSAPWRLRDVQIGQGGLTLVRASEFSAAPEGRVQILADWTPGDFRGEVKLSGKLAEVFGVRDPAGELHASGRAHGARHNRVAELRSLALQVKRDDGSELLSIETLQPLTFEKTAKNNHIDQAPDWMRVKTSAIPLEWLHTMFPAGLTARGVLEPVEIGLKLELPNAYLHAARPFAITLHELQQDGKPQLRDTRVEFKAAVILIGMFAALGVDDFKVTMDGKQTGLGSGNMMYLATNLTLPVSTSVDFMHEIPALRRQPAGAESSLPRGGTMRFIFNHDLMGDKNPVGTFLLYDVPTADGQGTLPRLGVRLTEVPKRDGSANMRLEFQYQTEPTWSQLNADLNFATKDKISVINTSFQGDYFDLGSFMQLVDACTPANAAPVPPHGAAKTAAPTGTPGTSAPSTDTLEGPFWQGLAGRIALDFKKMVYESYTLNDLTGELVIDKEAVQLRELTGKMFEGTWRGHFRMGYDWQRPATPYGLTGGFTIKDFSAEKIVQASYPTEHGSFSGTINFASTLESHTASPLDLLDQSTTRFEFSSTAGRLKLAVPYADVASAGLIVGGAITFSPELRAMGRLIKKFSDLPVDTLAARGSRDTEGNILLDEFKLSTPQLRLSARGKVPYAKGVDLAARSFELPVTLAAKDEIAVLLRGMKLLEKTPGADGYFAMTKQPALRGTLGQPDTTELYDVFAKAVDASSGTFGLLMKKVRKEVEKAQTSAAAAKKNP